MSASAPEARKGLSGYFSVSQGRVDRWRSVHRLAKSLAASGGKDEAMRARAAEEIAALDPLEELCAYPGPGLMGRVKDRLQSGDHAAFARLAQRISVSLLSNSYRDDIEAWKSDDEGDAHAPDVLPPGIGHGQARKPYFEVLVVSPGERSTWHETREALRRLRRDTDTFVYEPVVVGSFEDAVLAAIVNYNIQSVVIFDGFTYPSQHTVADLRQVLASHVPARQDVTDGDLGTVLARVLHAYRPELDLFLATDRDVGAPRRVGRGRVHPARVLRAGGDARDPPLDPGRHLRPLRPRPTSTTSRNTRSARSAPSTRCPSRAASRSSSRTGSATWASSTGPTCSSPSRRPPRAGSTACSSPRATSRSPRTRRRARWAATAPSS